MATGSHAEKTRITTKNYKFIFNMAISWTEDNASQESLNAWIHAAACMASVPAGIALYWLVALRHQPLVVACVIYSLSFASMYLFSMLSHVVREPKWRARVRACDQGFIYAFIAGTFTPFICAFTTDRIRLALLAFVWIAAALGFYSKVFAKHRINNMASLSYVLLGWIPGMVLFGYVSYMCFAVMALGGVIYTVGTLFLQNDHRSWYFHAVWHVLVILASACHYAAIVMFCVLHLDSY
jgi:hemolysin III